MIKFDDAKGMSKQDINEIENFTGFNLPQNIIELFTKNSGGRVKDDMEYFLNWKTKENIELDTWIVGVETKTSILANWKHRNYLKDYLDWYNIVDSYVEIEYLFPIFELVDGAIYVSIGGKHNNKIFYADNGDNGIICVSSSIEKFYDKLMLFELSTGKTVKLNRENQV